MLNYYTTIAKNIKDNYNKNNNGDLSNDFYNYCLVQKYDFFLINQNFLLFFLQIVVYL